MTLWKYLAQAGALCFDLGVKKLLQSVGPAIVVAAVVLGPGSILTSSKVGATFGPLGIPVVIVAAILMIGMVALAARIGVVYENSACDELSSRLGRPVSVAVGLILFLLVALFQSSNNIAVVAGLSPLVELMNGGVPMSVMSQVILLIVFNSFVISCLYLMRNLYGSIEKLMKILIGVMVISFLINFVVAYLTPRSFEPIAEVSKGDLIALLGMIGTTFSVGGAFYQCYLVKEKGWGIGEAKRGVIDSVVSISVLGGVTLVILLTATRVFYGNPEGVSLARVDDVARQLEPLFGSWATVMFSLGIVAGAFSSFLVNSMIGGTVMADSIGKGSRLSQPWPLHLTSVALLVGMTVAIFSIMKDGSTVKLITFAQALTVLGIPALAAALVYLGTRKELIGERRVPRWIIALASAGFAISCVLAVRTALAVWEKVGL
ncbi:MAG: divalent metal cation transporter [Verrucomicrobiales bacterium]|nr:divalent metal cation transporter [Verrucomicrobiales bacterium]